jgi:hypothetical protein
MGTGIFGLISRRRFHFAVGLCGVGALVSMALSFGLVSASHPTSPAVLEQAPSGRAVVDDAHIQQSPLEPFDPALREEMFRASLLMDISSRGISCQINTCAMNAPLSPQADLNKRSTKASKSGVAVSSVSGSTPAHVLSATPGAVKIGSLVCKSLETAPEFNCLLKLANKPTAIRYVAAVRQTSRSDLEVSKKLSITWDVFSRSRIFAERQFAGGYAADTSQPAASRRPGVLIGGGNDAFTLLPRTNQADAATVANMQLAAR